MFIHLFAYLFIYFIYLITIVLGGRIPAYITCYSLFLIFTLLLLLLLLLFLLLLLSSLSLQLLLILSLLLLSSSLLLLLLCYLYLFLHIVSSSFCSPTAATFSISWFLFFELICNYMGIVFFFNIMYHLYWNIVFYLFIC